jgi:hypothetical protein
MRYLSFNVLHIWDDRDSNPDALSSSKFSYHYRFRDRIAFVVWTVPWPYGAFHVGRARPVSTPSARLEGRSAWLGVVSEESAEFERIPRIVSGFAAPKKSAVSTDSTIIPKG